MYAGQYRDDESNLYYLRARYYDPTTGQFLTVDPAVSLTRSPYAYAAGNPLNFTDPSGRGITIPDPDPNGGIIITTIPEDPLGGNIGDITPVEDIFNIGDIQITIDEGGITIGCGPTEDVQGIGALHSDETGGGEQIGTGGGTGGETGTETLQVGPSGKPNFEDPSQSPGEGWEWRGTGAPGSSQGSWYNPGTGESLHPDLDHPGPIGPHYDYINGNGESYRINPNGDMTPK
jgi:RHS repeat-associated protein